MAAGYILGIEENGVSACPKHFVANNQEWRRMISDSIIDERTLREIYLTGFEIAIKKGKASAIMSSYNLLNGVYTNENQHLLVDILRNEWGFNGLVVTDWGGENDRIAGLKATNELEMPSAGGQTESEIITAVENGSLDEKILDAACERLIGFVLKTYEALKAAKTTFDIYEHHAFAKKVAAQSAVLLKNDGAILPLEKNQKIAIIGDFAENPRYQGAGSSMVNPTKLDSFVEVSKTQDDVIISGFARGFDRFGKTNASLIKEAILLAQNSDVIVYFCGLDEKAEVEGDDRSDMRLRENQIELLKILSETKKPIVAVLSCGSPVEMNWTKYTDAVLHMYLGGQAGAAATLDLLLGKINPSGKLAETYPLRYEDCPTAKYFHEKPCTAEYREGLYVGYRYYDTVGADTSYPFGFGLSYTSFEYSDININRTGVSFKIKNTGSFTGAEISQLYIGKDDSALHRPKKELKGFKKTYLNPGEAKEISIDFDEYAFRCFDTSANDWEIEDGKYSIFIGSSVKDIRLTGAIDISGKKISKTSVPEKYQTGSVADVSQKEFMEIYGNNYQAGDFPSGGLKFVKNNRIIVDFNTPVCDLRYARGWTGRFFAWALRRVQGFARLTKNDKLANEIRMGLYSMPLRGISRMTSGAFSWSKLIGLVEMFDGHFFKGIGKVIGK
jgi:beta-glucosidase